MSTLSNRPARPRRTHRRPVYPRAWAAGGVALLATCAGIVGGCDKIFPPPGNYAGGLQETWTDGGSGGTGGDQGGGGAGGEGGSMGGAGGQGGNVGGLGGEGGNVGGLGGEGGNVGGAAGAGGTG